MTNTLLDRPRPPPDITDQRLELAREARDLFAPERHPANAAISFKSPPSLLVALEALVPPRPLVPDITDHITRREFIVGAGAAALLAACGTDRATDEVTGPATRASTGQWSFTDDRGVSVTLPARPQRIAMQEDVAGALLPYGIRPAVVFGNAPLAESPQFQGEDLTGIEEAGISFGEINLEKLAAVDPDVILVPYSSSSPDDVTWMGFENETQAEQAAQIAPVVAIAVTDLTYSQMMVRFEDLAKALGADLSTPGIARMRQAFDEARAELQAAAQAKPGLVIAAIGPTEDFVYVVSPKADSELLEYGAAGLDIYDRGSDAVERSWELMSELPADVYLKESRSFNDHSFLADHPIWPTLPAVQAGQVGKWYVGTMYRMPFFTDRLRELAALIARSNDLVD